MFRCPIIPHDIHWQSCQSPSTAWRASVEGRGVRQSKVTERAWRASLQSAIKQPVSYFFNKYLSKTEFSTLLSTHQGEKNNKTTKQRDIKNVDTGVSFARNCERIHGRGKTTLLKKLQKTTQKKKKKESSLEACSDENREETIAREIYLWDNAEKEPRTCTPHSQV